MKPRAEEGWGCRGLLPGLPLGIHPSAGRQFASCKPRSQAPLTERVGRTICAGAGGGSELSLPLQPALRLPAPASSDCARSPGSWITGVVPSLVTGSGRRVSESRRTGRSYRRDLPSYPRLGRDRHRDQRHPTGSSACRGRAQSGPDAWSATRCCVVPGGRTVTRRTGRSARQLRLPT